MLVDHSNTTFYVVFEYHRYNIYRRELCYEGIFVVLETSIETFK